MDELERLGWPNHLSFFMPTLQQIESESGAQLAHLSYYGAFLHVGCGGGPGSCNRLSIARDLKLRLVESLYARLSPRLGRL